MQGQSNRSVKKLSDVLASYLAKSGLARELGTFNLQATWEQAVGAEIAEHTRATSLKAGLLRVQVDSTPWLHELNTFRKEQLLGTIGNQLAGRAVRDIEFRIGDIKKEKPSSTRLLNKHDKT